MLRMPLPESFAVPFIIILPSVTVGGYGGFVILTDGRILSIRGLKDAVLELFHTELFELDVKSVLFCSPNEGIAIVDRNMENKIRGIMTIIMPERFVIILANLI